MKISNKSNASAAFLSIYSRLGSVCSCWDSRVCIRGSFNGWSPGREMRETGRPEAMGKGQAVSKGWE